VQQSEEKGSKSGKTCTWQGDTVIYTPRTHKALQALFL
jgi:hypothetical protein